MRFFPLVVCAVLLVCLFTAGCSMRAPEPVPATTVPTPVPTVVPTTPLTDSSLSGPWTLEGGMVGTSPFISNVQVSINFGSDGTVSGFGGCNNYHGGYVLTGQATEFGKTITIGPVTTTQMYCGDTSSSESRYLSILQAVKTYTITNDKLMLRTADQSQLSYQRGYP